jgi:hypothetical protein
MSNGQRAGDRSPLLHRRELTREEAYRELQRAQTIRSQSRAQLATDHAKTGCSGGVRRLVELG